MAINPTAPGVYIQEISTLPPSVAPVATAIPAFIGYTEKAIIDGVAWTYPLSPTDPKPAPPVRISSMVEFEAIFGGPFAEKFDVVVSGTSPNFTVALTPKSITTPSDAISNYILYYQMQMYFGNGGGPCYVISADKFPTTATTISSTQLIAGIKRAEEVDEITLLVTPEAIKTSRNAIYTAMLDQCARLQDRFAILDTEVDTGNVSTDLSGFRGTDTGNNNLRYGAAYYPSLSTSLALRVLDTNIKTTAGSAAPYVSISIDNLLVTGTTLNIPLYNQIKAALDSAYGNLVLYPSGAMAGIYAAVDRTRGVWKAPANVSVNLVNKPTVIIDEDDNGLMNVHTSGKSVNAIRQFTDKGTLVWGARTLAGNDNEWRYVNVRRFFNYAEESIRKATEAVVFEPNDANTWLRVKGTITNFLTNEWRNGALVGAKPEHAFFVKVGLNETMSAQDILEGKLIIQVGMAVSRPAEFIILQFMHKLQEA